MSMTRKEFLGTMLGAAGAVALAGCGGDDGGGGTDAAARSCTMNGTSVTIETNHGHVLTVSSADVEAGVDKTYDIMGTATHTHSVTVTAANFATLKNTPNMTLMLTSTVGSAHTHGITIRCA